MIGPFYYERKGDLYLLTNDTGAYSLLSEEEFGHFRRNQMSYDTPKWKELEEKHFCHSGSLEGFLRHSENAIRDGNSYLFEATSLFILAVTNECNNRCIYCQANGNKKTCHMSEEVAEAALQKIAQSPSEKITIEFQGGEPLVNYRIIKYVIERAEVILKNKDVQFAVVSNLSLVTPEIADFFKKNNVSVSTSLDGPRSLHDLNRPSASGKSSYDEMIRGKKILNSAGIYLGAIETTTAYSLEYPTEIVDTYQKLGFHQMFLRPLTRLGEAASNWGKVGYTPERYLEFYKACLKRIIDYNLKGYDLMEYHAALFLSKIIRGKAVNYMELRSPCGAGLGQMAITADGNVYTCDEGRMMAEIGDESFRIGNVFLDDYDNWIESPCCHAVCSASLLDTLPTCSSCVYKPYCGVCPVVNYAINGNIVKVSKDKCKIYKGILDALFEYIIRVDPSILKIFAEWSERV